MPLRRRVSSALLLLVVPLLLPLAGCDNPTAPEAIREAMRLEKAAVEGDANARWAPATTLAWLVRTGNAGQLRVVRDGREVVYRAFVFERAYSPARGNGDRGAWDFRSALLIAWRDDDWRDHFTLRGGAQRGEFQSDFATDNDIRGVSPRPWLTFGKYIAVSGTGDVHFDGGGNSCEGLKDDAWYGNDATERPALEQFRGMAPDGQPYPAITCARASYTVDAAAVMRVAAGRDTTAASGARPMLWMPGERRFEIPPQSVPGRRLVIYCNETTVSDYLGCGWPMPSAPHP